MKDYGNAIKTLRKRNQTTQAALAEKLNVSGQAVSKWENNMAQPDLDTVLKITEIFGVSLDEFTRLCDLDAVDATPAASEVAVAVGTAPAAVEPVHTPATAPILIGVCGQCGRSIYNEKELGARTPKILCENCVAVNASKKKEAEEKKQHEELAKRAEQLGKLRRSLIIPAIVVVSIVLLLSILTPSIWWFWSAAGILIYVIVVLVRWDNNIVSNIVDWTFGVTFAKPGLIIPLSLDGFLWALGVKIAMAVIWFFLSLAVSLFGLVLCVLVFPIAIPLAIIKTKKEIENNEFMSLD